MATWAGTRAVSSRTGSLNFPVTIYMKLQALQWKSLALVGVEPCAPAGAHRVAFQYCLAVICQPHGARTGKGCGVVTHRAQAPTEAVRGKAL